MLALIRRLIARRSSNVIERQVERAWAVVQAESDELEDAWAAAIERHKTAPILAALTERAAIERLGHPLH